MSTPRDSLHSLGCDYVTATVADERSSPEFHAYATTLFRTESDCGHKVKPFTGSGFKGWQCGSVQISTLDHRCMVRLSSHVAARAWRPLVQLSDNVSRFDLQATFGLEGDVTARINRHLKAAAKHSAALDHKPVVRWIRDLRGGYTLYLGGRESLCFGRIYDKWQREKLDHYKGTIRFEVQFQKKLSRMVGRTLLALDSPMPRMASYVTQFFQDRGVDLRIRTQDKARYSCSRNRSDDDKNLGWLQHAVRPCVLRLIDAGRGEDVFQALGLIPTASEDSHLLDHADQHSTQGG